MCVALGGKRRFQIAAPSTLSSLSWQFDTESLVWRRLRTSLHNTTKGSIKVSQLRCVIQVNRTQTKINFRLGVFLIEIFWLLLGYQAQHEII